MNHVLPVTCCRSSGLLLPLAPRAFLDFSCLPSITTQLRHFSAGRAGSSTLRSSSSGSSTEPSSQSSRRTWLQASVPRSTSNSSFHTSAPYTKAKKSRSHLARDVKPYTPIQAKSVRAPRPSAPQRASPEIPYSDPSLTGPVYPGTDEYDSIIQRYPIAELTEADKSELVSPRMEIDTVREWLAVLQFQRETGTLDRGLAMPTVTEDLVRRLVEWLRKTYAVDEDAAIIRRIEREEEASADYAPQKYPPGTSVYGDSAWEAMMEERNKRRALEKQQKEEAEEAAKQTVNTVEGPMDVERADRPQILVRKKREESEWVKKYRERAMLSDKDQKEFPLLGRWQRLVPSMLLTGLVLGFCLALATYYIPPPRLARLFPDTPPAASTVMMLISANVAVWVLWHIPPCWRFLNRYFILVPGAPYALSILGAGFSHQQFRHLLVNMVGLWFLGTWLHDDVGRGNFLATYFGTQVIAAMGSMSVFVAQGILNTTMLGASGAIYGLLGAQFAKHWGETFRISFLPEEMNIRFGSGTILLLVAAFEIFQLTRYGLLVDRFSHLFGLGAGAIIGLLLRMKEKEGAPVEEEQVPKLREDGSKMEFPSDPVALLNKALGKGGGEIDGNDHRGGQS